MYKFIMGFISNNTVFGIASILARLEKVMMRRIRRSEERKGLLFVVCGLSG